MMKSSVLQVDFTTCSGEQHLGCSCCVQVSWELELFQPPNWDSAVSQVRLNWVTETHTELLIVSLLQLTIRLQFPFKNSGIIFL